MTVIVAKGVLFDMDGTLVDTTACVERAWRDKAILHGLDEELVVRGVHGRPTIDMLRAHFPPECHSADHAHAFEAAFVEVREGVRAVPGAHAALAAVADAPWAVVTAASGMWARKRLSQVDLPPPPHLVAAEDVALGKPDPEGYRRGARALGLDPSETVAFEDSPLGVMAAVAAGATVVALLTSSPRERLEAAGAHHIVEDLSHVAITNHGDQISIAV
ncbi:hypothetical protein H4R21_005028 [Coemansia helicoidea]|uniref:Uncharacterized protein n=1 Tax=Coemansia helicoidea TaxID=1286919 RepID=A0ACC1KW06_9FUNG|nr:hypothetical protein H4R21_005028 [Coemansia helicoidea]